MLLTKKQFHNKIPEILCPKLHEINTNRNCRLIGCTVAHGIKPGSRLG